MSGHRLIYSTWPDADSAEAAARAVIDENLAACANILPGAVSLYRWEGKVMRDPESIMILKTTADAAAALIERLADLHPYDTPALSALALDEAASHAPYLAWLDENCR